MKSLPIDTPALLVDLDAMERNLVKMASFLAAGPTRLRPHYKNHKCPDLARRQLALGAAGITCATLTEAETLVERGFTDVLIASEIAGDRKIARFANLAGRANVKATVDNPKTVAALGSAAREKKQQLDVVVNVDVGQHRTGVSPGRPAAELAVQARAEGLRVRGLMGYEGHLGHLAEGPGKEAAYDEAMSGLMKSRAALEEAGIRVEIVSAGGTGTYQSSRRFPQITELQAGSYVLMDTQYAATCKDFETTLTVLGTVISKTDETRAVVDVGLKSISGELGTPVLKSCGGGWQLRKLNAEHGIIDILDSSVPVEVGDTVEIWVHYGDATVNLHDRMYGIRNGEVQEAFTLW